MKNINKEEIIDSPIRGDSDHNEDEIEACRKHFNNQYRMQIKVLIDKESEDGVHFTFPELQTLTSGNNPLAAFKVAERPIKNALMKLFNKLGDAI